MNILTWFSKERISLWQMPPTHPRLTKIWDGKSKSSNSSWIKTEIQNLSLDPNILQLFPYTNWIQGVTQKN